MKMAQQQTDQIFCALCREPLGPDTPPGRKVCDGCMGNGAEAQQSPTQTCSKCKRVLPLTPEYFYRAAKQKSGFQGECKGCHNRVNNAAKKARRKHERTAVHAVKTNPATNGLLQQEQLSTPDGTKITVDLSSYPDLLAYLTDLSRDQERSLEGQIRWILRQCHKYRTETPSAACGEA